MKAMAIETETLEVEFEVSIEVDDGTVISATGKTVPAALHLLADRVKNHPCVCVDATPWECGPECECLHHAVTPWVHPEEES